MIMASVQGLAEIVPTRKDKNAGLLPPLTAIRAVSRTVARAVGRQAIKDGLAQIDAAQFEKELDANIWEPLYEAYE
jgi:malate dehydrogenase (oxaloacetate-decarboxylating)